MWAQRSLVRVIARKLNAAVVLAEAENGVVEFVTNVKSGDNFFDRSLVVISWCLILPLLFGVRAQKTEVDGSSNQQTAEKMALYDDAARKLTGIFREAADIPNIFDQANLVATVALILANEKREQSQLELTSLLDKYVKDFKGLSSVRNRTAEESRRLSELDKAMQMLIRALIKLDAREAERYRGEIQKIKQGTDLKRDAELLIREYAGGLGLDRDGALALILTTLIYGIPENFVGLVYALNDQDPDAARFLTNAAIQNLASNPAYTVNDAIILSTIILGESSTIYPVITDSTVPNQFGWNTLTITAPPFVARPDLRSRYFSTVTAYLRNRLLSGGPVRNSPDELIKGYFLIEKLRFHSLVTGRSWTLTEENLRVQLIGMLGPAGFSEETVAAVSDTARRIVERNNPFRLEDGTKLLDEADKQDDPKAREVYLARAAIRLIESGNFPEAERVIARIDDTMSRQALNELFAVRIADRLAKSKDYGRLDYYTSRIENPAVVAFVLLNSLESGYGQLESSDRLNLISSAEKAIEKIDNRSMRASAYVVLASIISQSEYDVRSALNAVKAIVAAEDYVGDPFRISIQIPVLGVTYSFTSGKDSFEQLFRRLAIKNWPEAQLQASQLRPKYTALLAEAYAAAAILGKYRPQE